MKKSLLKISLAVTLSSLLIACGGGGGGGSNSGNPSQPIQPAPKPAPDPAPQPKPPAPNPQPDPPAPKPQPNDPMPHPREPETPPKANEWSGKCESSQDFCTLVPSNKINIYDLVTTEDTGVGHDVTTEKEQTITLILENNEYQKIYSSNRDSNSNYSFTLLSAKSTSGDIYYGYRQRANNNKNGRHYDFIYAYRSELAAKIPDNYTAYYEKSDGFIYSPLNLASTSDNNLLFKGNVKLTYNNGKVTGWVEGGTQSEAIFKIYGEGTNLIVESTNAVTAPISPNQKGEINVHFIDSTKGANDYKYLVGTGKSQNGADKTGWVGVLFAEKQSK
ncbi:MAG: hypothetical protein Q4D86_07035 [Pasteurella oralis]|uniref:hypothetical protein n=1 Tax=Pasteurella oralis TaxID=1071947 RepID=UPI002707663A|nr:hypothetical protein [Pasteurella oralis]